MPNRPPIACACGRADCTRHARGTWHRNNPVRRLRGRPLARARLRLYVAARATCASCGRIVALDVSIRDHRIPLAEGGSEHQTNEQLLCIPCHDTKTADESRRGIRSDWPRSALLRRRQHPRSIVE